VAVCGAQTEIFLNGYDMPAWGWGRAVYPAPPGQYHVHVYLPYCFRAARARRQQRWWGRQADTHRHAQRPEASADHTCVGFGFDAHLHITHADRSGGPGLHWNDDEYEHDSDPDRDSARLALS
jgi:hypothetical protein